MEVCNCSNPTIVHHHETPHCSCCGHWHMPEFGSLKPGEKRSNEARRELRTKTTTLKVGRNDNCPCGSGKKFKKCHWASIANPGTPYQPAPLTLPTAALPENEPDRGTPAFSSGPSVSTHYFPLWTGKVEPVVVVEAPKTQPALPGNKRMLPTLSLALLAGALSADLYRH